MKKLIFLFFLINSLNLTAQNMGEWTWMKGTNTLNSNGVFGIKGVPDTANYPPGLYEACSWTDTAGNFWLFGGAISNFSNYNTLWKYSHQNNMWTWINGSNVIDDLGSYGIKSVPSSANCPPSRGYGIMSWTDKNNNLWLYGGFNSLGGIEFQDLWKYDISTNEWTWVSGSNTNTNLTNYGTQGVASQNNNPPKIKENNCTWIDASNNLWFFGGLNNIGSNLNYFNDLWKFNILTNEWTWIYGNATPNINPIHGQKGISNISNNPGGRCSYASFTDFSDNLFFFGSGKNFFNQGFSDLLNDIWKYNKITNTWTWISGENIINFNGNYGNICFESKNLSPSSRYEVRSCWTDSCGFWIYGGFFQDHNNGFSDFWRYNYITESWTRISGTNALGINANYGIKGVSSPFNHPGERGGAVSWMDKKGNLWMFGGWGNKNDLWRYVPDTNCVKLCLPKSNLPIPNPNPDTLKPEIKIPNIFTPNSDGINDKFEIIAKNFKIYYLQVFNRWGVLVFESKDATTLWDGTMHNRGNACSDGVYFYILNLIDFKQNTTQHKGSVTILR